MLKDIHIRGFKAVRDSTSLSLGPLTVLADLLNRRSKLLEIGMTLANGLIAIEELENGLDPWTLKLVMSALREAAEDGVQIVITTHSPFLLNHVEPSESPVRAPRTGRDHVRSHDVVRRGDEVHRCRRPWHHVRLGLPRLVPRRVACRAPASAGSVRRRRGSPSSRKARSTPTTSASSRELAAKEVHAKVPGTFKSNKHAWAEWIVRNAPDDARLWSHPIAERLRTLLAVRPTATS